MILPLPPLALRGGEIAPSFSSPCCPLLDQLLLALLLLCCVPQRVYLPPASSPFADGLDIIDPGYYSYAREPQVAPMTQREG